MAGPGRAGNPAADRRPAAAAGPAEVPAVVPAAVGLTPPDVFAAESADPEAVPATTAVAETVRVAGVAAKGVGRPSVALVWPVAPVRAVAGWELTDPAALAAGVVRAPVRADVAAPERPSPPPRSPPPWRGWASAMGVAPVVEVHSRVPRSPAQRREPRRVKEIRPGLRRPRRPIRPRLPG